MNPQNPRLWTLVRRLPCMGLAVSTAMALCGFSAQFANPNEFKWEWLAAGNGCILLATGVSAWSSGMRMTLDRVDGFLLAFLTYAAASLVWSADAESGKLAVVKWGLLALPFLYLKHVATVQTLLSLTRAVAVGNGVVMIVVMLGLGNWGGFGNENFLAEFQLMSLPFLLALCGREQNQAVKAPIVLLIGLEAVDLVIFNPSRIEWLVGLMALVLLAQRILWQRHAPVYALAINGMVLALLLWLWSHALWPDAFYRESIRPRFALYLNTLKLWADAPVFGGGAASFDALYPLYKEGHLQYFEHADKLLNDKMVKAGAAHNEVLQLLAEYGLIGFGLLAGFLLQLWRCWRRRASAACSYAMAGGAVLLTGAAIGGIEFPLQNPATALLLTLGAGFVANRCPRTPPVIGFTLREGQARGLALSALAALLLLGVGTYRFDQANRLFGQVAGRVGSDPRQAFTDNREAHRLNPWDRRIRMQLYTTLTFWAENSPEPVVSAAENDRVYAISSKGGEHQPVLLLARVQHLLNSGRFAEKRAETDALLAKLTAHSSRMADVWILEAYYALLVSERGRAVDAIARARSLGPTAEQAENLRRLREAL